MTPDELPDDFGQRVRAAVAYRGVPVKDFGDLLDRPGMSASTIRAYVEGRAKHPPPLSQEAFVRRLSEVSGLPERFFWGDKASEGTDAHLARIEGQLQQLLNVLGSEGQGDLSDRIVKTVERGLSRQAREALRPPPKPAEAQGRFPQPQSAAGSRNRP